MQPAIRFHRDECIDLPPCIYETRTVALTPVQAKAYKEMMNQLVTQAEGGEITAVNEAVKAQKLLQIAAGCVYDEDGKARVLDATPRLKLVHEIVEDAGTKVIVFVPFVSAVHMVDEYLVQQKHTVACIHGGVSKTHRDKIFSDFMNSDNPKVLVAQPAAMSHGLTLTAASTIIWYAPITSNDIFEQACGRITRPGQRNTQLILMVEGTDMERRYYARLKAKQRVQGLLLEAIRSTRESLTQEIT